MFTLDANHGILILLDRVCDSRSTFMVYVHSGSDIDKEGCDFGCKLHQPVI